MPPKTLRWWESEWHSACILACVYGCELSLDQFCASRGLEPDEREVVREHFEKAKVGV